MRRFIPTAVIGFACALPLMGCVVPAQPGPPPPVAMVAPPVVAPVVVGPPAVVVGGGYWRWHHGHRIWVRGRRGARWRHHR